MGGVLAASVPRPLEFPMPRPLAAGAASLLSILIVLGDPGSACACSCAEMSEQAAFDGADAVFAGTLTDSGTGVFDEKTTLEFTVDEVYKGRVAESQGVLTLGSEASCRWEPPVGEAYLVFASLEDGRLTAGLCNGSRPLDGTPLTLDVQGAEPLPGEADTAEDALRPSLAVAALLAVIGAAWWLRRRHLRRI
jgi:hypothetical protein